MSRAKKRTDLPPSAVGEKNGCSLQGLGARQTSGVFRAPAIPKRQRTAAVQNADATATQDFLIWQLADSAFPTGGFAHSAGLEAAWQHGEVRSRDELVSFVKASLEQSGHAALPFVNAAHADPDRLEEFDRLCDAFTSNHVANRASRAQGRALLAAVERIFPERGVHAASTPNNESALKESEGLAPHAHLAPVFGAVMMQLGLSRERTTRLFLFCQLRSLLAAAVRLNIVGPMEAQTLQRNLSADVEQVLQRCSTLTLDDLAQTSPLLDLWQGAHDRLYSRLFQS